MRKGTHFPVSLYAVDVGSIPRGRLGWAHAHLPGGSVDPDAQETDIRGLVSAVKADLLANQAVALGFECPLYVPVPAEAQLLGKARAGDANRSWSASAGSGAMATGLVQAAWCLRELRAAVPEATAFLEWEKFRQARSGLFLWEAFVTATAKAQDMSHHGDAAIAVERFAEVIDDPVGADPVSAERPLSLIAAAALWAGWLSDPAELHTACLVVKAEAVA